jgi:hypothetical protein
MAFDRLIDELAMALGAGDSEDHVLQQSELTGAATFLRENVSGVRRLLTGLANDPALAGEIAARSYWHSNGFAKLVLHENDAPEFRVRLHVWTDGSGPAAQGYQNVHTHRWPFASVVLCGSLVTDEFEETSDHDDPKARSYQQFAYAGTPGLFGQLRPLSTCSLRPTRSAPYGDLDIHSCETSTLHRVRPMAATTATIVVQGPSHEDHSLVYQRVGRPPVQDTGCQLNAADVVTLARLTLDAMSQPVR